VARQILALAERYGRPLPGAPSGTAGASGTQAESIIPLRLTQSDLGEVVGASRERVNQAMVDFKQRGYVSVDSDHRIHVLDRAALARYCV
jgi:CRP-like cAMP-binding protein